MIGSVASSSFVVEAKERESGESADDVREREGPSARARETNPEKIICGT